MSEQNMLECCFSRLTFHDQDVAGVAVSLEQAVKQQHPAIGFRDTADDELHGPLALPRRQGLGLVPQASDLNTVNEVHDQHPPCDKPGDAAGNGDLLGKTFVFLHPDKQHFTV